MNTVITDLQPILTTAFIGIVIGYARYVHNLKERVAVLEKTVVDMRDEMLNVTGNIMKTIENIQKRQDSHSRKQDDILNRISAMEKEVLKEVGAMGAQISSMGSELKGLSNMLLLFDGSATTHKNGK